LFETASVKKYHPVNIHKEIKRQGKKFDSFISPALWAGRNLMVGVPRGALSIPLVVGVV